MKHRFLQISNYLLAVTIMLLISNTALAQQKKVLVFVKWVGFNHASSIASGMEVIKQLGKENNFGVDTTVNAGKFTSENLKQYAAVIFLSTTGNVLNDDQQKAFEQYIRAGGGYVGIHSATDTEPNWPWYGELVGAYFAGHPSKHQEAIVNVVDRNNIATRHLPAVWMKTDELYSFKWFYEGIHPLLMIDENSYDLMGQPADGAYHPMAWYHDFDGGRSFYTAFGHEKKYMEDPIFIKHLLGGIKYALGAKPDAELTAAVK